MEHDGGELERGDEMLLQLSDNRDAIIELCQCYGVLRLAVFGSAVTDEFEPERSDVDFLVEFDPGRRRARFDDYFGLKEALEALLSRQVDLVTREALANPYFAESVERMCTDLYAA
ncbi:MAG: nucleotidyltransferase family protein [Acidimicrobiales bacterium]